MNAMTKLAKTESGVPSDLAVPPGEYLAEVIRDLGMTKDELATRMARPASKLSRIFKGEKAITADTALQLEKVVGVPAHIWLGLESEYRLSLARQGKSQEPEHLKSEAGLVDPFCYKELVKLGAITRVHEASRKGGRVAALFRRRNTERGFRGASLPGGVSMQHLSGSWTFAPRYCRLAQAG